MAAADEQAVSRGVVLNWTEAKYDSYEVTEGKWLHSVIVPVISEGSLKTAVISRP